MAYILTHIPAYPEKAEQKAPYKKEKASNIPIPKPPTGISSCSYSLGLPLNKYYLTKIYFKPIE